MKSETLKKNEIYKVFNDITLKNEIIIFGSTFTANFPFYELAHKHLLSNAIYNRSINELTLADAAEILDNCVLRAKPSKVFYALGEHDTEEKNSLNIYEEILRKTKDALPRTKIYVLSVPSLEKEGKTYNTLLKKLCENISVEFIETDYNKSYSSIYKQLSLFFRKGKISFGEAFNITDND